MFAADYPVKASEKFHVFI